MNPYHSSGLEILLRPAYKRTMRSRDFDLASVANSAARFAGGAACLALVFAAHASMAAVVDDASLEAPPSPQASQIYQQRTADGRVVLTDRPAAGAVTQRTWKMIPEDPVAALQRREQSRAEVLAIDERIQRRIDADAQRDHELTLARMRAAGEQTRLDAELARAANQDSAYFAPGYFAQRPFRHPPRNPRPAPPRSRHPVFGMFGSQPG
jgi:hypothetical protein